ncbi:hypothetical protein CON65_17975 [Bacillus pseudomycoides]|uniref:Uncharacterized protein n=1 Tax=Bacillus pseudomycoides TaxID=64104 RepID=A0AA91V9W7_9BACI|nr:hypothetical protein COO03_13630 [Bacillus sp. AFS098217]PED81283.1 hypothetical protein CON65_17975 [Bacillus pseudomycoides]PEU06393.1 hypothetical protein CN524_23705 [Bacillus sp. AFS019443]PEU21086.1 hypothetical protein CN525_02870 [Bacillus sp. AFS014408]PFW65093.1 hypothetical protein COL20_01995 [Bacillus sp. AFS075034]
MLKLDKCGFSERGDFIGGVLLVIYILYSFFLKDESDLKVITILTVLLITSVILDKRNIKKRMD